eukprot:Blabericola_migrator_1__4147@NODE_2267_length_3033_cov_515_046190_g1427_i0_p1_GENE_NODE_2267_length_3033_cov_515_046190_g1427_i0NODE_2267_length_3033_cov_515_046190_g1427_i0_p1_ORF_typecomplete_len464_score53_03DUF3024/PF11225_8/0_24DUF3024/PF11225_8/4_6e03DUF3024/PF11225_8/2_3e02_NODE_2267_length_3033_cov_515_046190_g1427_i015902981
MSLIDVLDAVWSRLRGFLDYESILKLQSINHEIGLWTRRPSVEVLFMKECLQRTWGLYWPRRNMCWAAEYGTMEAAQDDPPDILDVVSNHLSDTDVMIDLFEDGCCEASPPFPPTKAAVSSHGSTYADWPTETNRLCQKGFTVHRQVVPYPLPQTWLEVNLLLDVQERFAYNPLPEALLLEDGTTYIKATNETQSLDIWKLRRLAAYFESVTCPRTVMDGLQPSRYFGCAIYRRGKPKVGTRGMTYRRFAWHAHVSDWVVRDYMTVLSDSPLAVDVSHIMSLSSRHAGVRPELSRLLCDDPSLSMQLAMDPLDYTGLWRAVYILSHHWAPNDPDESLEQAQLLLRQVCEMELSESKLRLCHLWHEACQNWKATASAVDRETADPTNICIRWGQKEVTKLCQQLTCQLQEITGTKCWPKVYAAELHGRKSTLYVSKSWAVLIASAETEWEIHVQVDREIALRPR